MSCSPSRIRSLLRIHRGGLAASCLRRYGQTHRGRSFVAFVLPLEHVGRVFTGPAQSHRRRAAPRRSRRARADQRQPPSRRRARAPRTTALVERGQDGAHPARGPRRRGAARRPGANPRPGGRASVSTAILDTSIFVAVEQGRPLDRPLPDSVSVSVVTLAELELGVLVARDADARAQRLATRTRVREKTGALPADERVASAYARLAAGELTAGRKPRIHDTWIAATALVHRAEVWTQDDDFSSFAAVDVVRV